ncbi:MAG: rhodanese-related sulfurtransferase [Bacteroidota bacterium]
MEQKNYLVLAYYLYLPIEDPIAYREAHHLFCIQHNIRGRVIIAKEGLNGTVSGSREDCEAYMRYLKADERFKEVVFKIHEHDEMAFAKIHVRVKEEIVHSGLVEFDPNQLTGEHISPEAFKQIKDEEDVVILDVRSTYEHRLGKFKDAVTLDIDNFREFPEKIKELGHLKGKKIITYCTGGIKCEKASGYLLEQGFENVYQLHGGIIQYGLDTDGEDFEGKCYVFDNRLAVDINTKNPTVLSQCYVCGTVSDRMVNCANPHCNIHVPICENCGWELEGACSTTCKTHPDKRPYDGTGYYAKKMNGYNPYKGWKRKTSPEE